MSKRLKMTLTRAQVELVHTWAEYNEQESLTEGSAAMYKAIRREAQKALAYDEERRGDGGKALRVLLDQDHGPDAYAFFAQRAKYYMETGIVFCGTCKVTPEKSLVFSENMPCGHPWTVLMWREKTPDEYAGSPTPGNGEP